MLLSFQRPSRAPGRGLLLEPALSEPPRPIADRTRQYSAPSGPMRRAPVRGAGTGAAAQYRQVGRTERAQAASRADTRSVPGLAPAQAPECALADLQHRAVQALGRARPGPRRAQRLAVELDRRPGRACRRASERERAERVGDQRRQVDRAVGAVEARLLDLVGQRVLDEDAVEVRGGRVAPPAASGSARRAAAPARAWRRAATSRRRAARRAAARTSRPSPRRAAPASCRTSPRAARSRRCGCPATSTSSARRRCPAGSASSATTCSGSP